MTKRKRYSAEFTAKVALEAIREELTTEVYGIIMRRHKKINSIHIGA